VTELRDPEEIYRESLASIPAVIEARPPVVERFEVWPYPDLTRLWVRVETSPFAAFPNLALCVLDPDGQTASSMFLVEIRERYQSLTMHLRQTPRAGALYRLELEISRDEATLDARAIEFELVFRDPDKTHP
jgi:hypothetical protein